MRDLLNLIKLYEAPSNQLPNVEEIEAVQQYFEVSKKEAKEYINMLPKEELEIITQQVNGK